MLVRAYKRYLFSGNMWLPKENPNDSNGRPVLVLEKVVFFDMSIDPNSPRTVLTSNEPFPTGAQIRLIKDKDGVEPLEGAIYKITSVSPVFNAFGQRHLYVHKAGLVEPLDFNYEDIQRD